MAGIRDVVVDHSACAGSAVCVRLAPAVFELDADRRAQAHWTAGGDEQAVRRAERSCPRFAIRLSAAGNDPSS